MKKPETPQAKTILPEKVAELYDVVPGTPAIFSAKDFDHVDLSKIDLDVAARLAERGHLIRKENL